MHRNSPPFYRIATIVLKLLRQAATSHGEHHAKAFLSSLKVSDIWFQIYPTEVINLFGMKEYVETHNITRGHSRKKPYDYTEENFTHHCKMAVAPVLNFMGAARNIANIPPSQTPAQTPIVWPSKKMTEELKRDFVALIHEYRASKIRYRLLVLWGLTRGKYTKILPFEITQKVFRYLPLHFLL
jgi:hypothetical protein